MSPLARPHLVVGLVQHLFISPKTADRHVSTTPSSPGTLLTFEVGFGARIR
jgi:hypothetical protein